MPESATLICDIISHAHEGDRLVMTAEQDTKNMSSITSREDDNHLANMTTRDEGTIQRREREMNLYFQGVVWLAIISFDWTKRVKPNF